MEAPNRYFLSSRMVLSLTLVVYSALLLFTITCKALEAQNSSPYDNCPPDDDIYPCYCEADTNLISVNCEKVHDLEKVKGILKNIKGLNVSIGFWDSRLGDIPSDLFSGQICKSVQFQNCRIGSFGEKPFTGLEDTLESVDIYESVNKKRKDLETLPLGHLKKLKYFSFQANDIKKLGNEWFEGGPSTVEELSLETNDIEVLGDKAFADLPNVRQIWLGDNRFGVVHRSMFPRPANKLQLLEISFNGIEVLPDDFFSDMPSLTDVNVSGNKLKTIEEKVWGGIWGQLKEVYVGRNLLECDKNLKWIYTKTLPGILDGQCGGYNDLRGKYLEDLTLDDFE